MPVTALKNNILVSLIKLLRPEQWVKNLFMFIPAFFAGTLFEYNILIQVIIGFFSFCFAASGIYIINDYRDIEADRNHPEKCHRPLASGEISPAQGLTAMVILLAAGLLTALWINIGFFSILLIYVLINIGYSFGLKHISILDIMIVASGFLFRTIAGGLVADVPISQWLVIMIFLLALFLALAKRRDDLIIGMQSGKLMRKSVQHYNLDFTNACLTMLSGIIIVSYLMYTISQDVTERWGEHLYFTSIFVIAGIMRYLQITLVENNSGSPTKLLYVDNFIRFTLLGWILSFFIIIYAHKF